MKIIVNADDLGKSIEVNDAIFALIARRLVTSSSILVNAPAFEDAVEKIHRCPQCSFGIHLNVTEFPPLTSNPSFKGFLDEQGNFLRENLYRPINLSLLQAIFSEWCAQIDKALLHGIKISHIDSHDHIHTRKLQLFPCLKWIQKKYNISKVRITKNIYSSIDPIRSKTLHYKKKIYNYALKKFYPTVTTSGFTDFTNFLKVARIERPSHSSIEIMVHPGHPNQYFVDEISLLLTPWIDELAFQVKLINYDEL